MRITNKEVDNGESASGTKSKTSVTKNGGISKNKNKKQQKESACRSKTWKIYQKEQFVIAFKKAFENEALGDGEPSEDAVRKIGEVVLGRSEADIKQLIMYNCRKIKAHRSATDGPIDKWFELIDALSPDKYDLEEQLGYVMKVASEEPIDVGGEELDPNLPQPNYSNIYNYLSCALSNKTLPSLSSIDSLVLEDCMQSLAYQIKCLDEDEIRKSLRKVYLHLAKLPNQDQEADVEEVRRNLMHNASMLNPLGLNAQAIVPVMRE